MLIIDHGEPRFADAKSYWTMDTIEAQEAIHRDLGSDFEIACIGPAGENLVKYANIIFGRRAAGRCGGGAVLGSKNAKAIAVRGSESLELQDIERFDEDIRSILEAVKRDQEMIDYRLYGTPSLVQTLNELGMLPTRNFLTGVFDGAEEIGGERMRKKVVSRDSACFACAVACGKVSSIHYKGEDAVTEGPEYETIYALGSNCGINSIHSVAVSDYVCDRMGMDTITTGNVIAFLMECHGKGLLKGKLRDFRIRFGEHAKVPEIIETIARREGFGSEMAEGVRHLSRTVGQGSETFAMHAKGLELGGYDPRGAKGEGLAMATSERGGCHHAGGYTMFAEVYSGKMDRFSSEGKGALVKELRKKQLIFDSVIMCVFYSGVVYLDTVARLLKSATGYDFTPSSLQQAAERISDTERTFNFKAGTRRKDDSLPRRLTNSPMPSGPCKGQRVDLDPMLEQFYDACGWDSEDAAPREAVHSASGR
jgi:aldehyde:ferredoxin oxidoreductase